MRVAKWGNGLGVRLARKLVEEMGLKAGDEVEVVDAARDRLALGTVDQRQAALRRLAERRWGDLPADYRFDREEANAR